MRSAGSSGSVDASRIMICPPPTMTGRRGSSVEAMSGNVVPGRVGVRRVGTTIRGTTHEEIRHALAR